MKYDQRKNRAETDVKDRKKRTDDRRSDDARYTLISVREPE